MKEKEGTVLHSPDPREKDWEVIGDFSLKELAAMMAAVWLFR
jgi:hypothetical protein